MSAGIMHISLREWWPLIGLDSSRVVHHRCKQIMIYISEADSCELNLSVISPGIIIGSA